MDSKAIDPSVAGLGLFGSVAKHVATRGSDIDLLELRTDVLGRSVHKIRSNRGVIDVQIWPLYEFVKLLYGECSSAYYDAFKFDVLRTAEILYDPNNLLKRMKAYAMANSLPRSSQCELLDRSKASLRVAMALLEKNNLGSSQILLRQAVDEFAKSVLLGSDIASVNPSRVYLRNLRSIDPDVYRLVLETYGARSIRPSSAISLVQNVNAWIDSLTVRKRCAALPSTKACWLSVTASEVADASRDIARGDFLAATIQARHTAVLIDVYERSAPTDGSLENTVPNMSSQGSEAKSTKCELLGLSYDAKQLQQAEDELCSLIDMNGHRALIPRVKK